MHFSLDTASSRVSAEKRPSDDLSSPVCIFIVARMISLRLFLTGIAFLLN